MKTRDNVMKIMPMRVGLGLLLVLGLSAIAFAPILLADSLPLDAAMISLDHQHFPFIYLSVAVERNSEGISTFTESNFQVTENEVLQTDYFDVVPPQAGGGVRVVDIVFLMDNSGSMSNEQNAVRENVKEFVDALTAQGVDYQLGLCRFGATTNGGNPIIEDGGTLTADADYFKNVVWARNVTSGGYEPGWDALYEAVSSFSFRQGSQKVFILITDETPTGDGNIGTRSKEETIAILQDHYITAFALIVTSDSHAVSDYGEIAEQTNGAYYDILDPLDSILDYISNLIPNAYRVVYRSSQPTFDGVERHVVVTVSYQVDQATCEGKYTPGSAPMIQRTEDTLALHNQSWAAGTPFTIKAKITDAVTPLVQNATLYYRKTGNTTYTPTPMGHSSDIWSATIPADAVETPGVDYYISATDGQSTVTDPSTDPRTRPHQLAILPNVAPQIAHTPPSNVLVNQPVLITAQITDTTNALASATLWYRKVGQLVYEKNNGMANTTGDSYRDTIPSQYVTIAGVEYYIFAKDDLGVGSYHGTPDSPNLISLSGNKAPNTEITNANIDSANGTAKFTWTGTDDTTSTKDLVYSYRLVRPGPAYDAWSGWSSGTTKRYTDLPAGSYKFEVRAKDGDGEDDPSPAIKEFTVEEAENEPPDHTSTTPDTPSGPSSGEVEELLPFSTGGSTCSQGHSVQYRFDWGDGNYSNWSSSTSSSYSYSSAGTYQVKAQARCASDTSVVSSWSPPHAVTILATEPSNLHLARVTAAKRNIRSAAHVDTTLDNIVGTVIKGWLLEVISTTGTDGKPVLKDGFEWWEVREASYEDKPMSGWIAAKDAAEGGKTYVELVDSSKQQILPAEFPGYMGAETFDDFIDERTTWAQNGGSTGWVNKDGITLCLGFVRSFFRSPRKYISPKAALEVIESKGKLFSPGTSWNPPPGAIIFLDAVKKTAQSKYGHIGVYIGDGYVLHVKDYQGNVGKVKLSSLDGYSYLGWSFPEVLGFVWVGQTRVVTGRLNVRKGHSTDEDVKKLLPTGTQIEILQHEENWTYEDGYHWWYVSYAVGGVQDTGWAAELYHWAFLGSPGELTVHDEEGHVTGVVDGVSKEEIPWSHSFPDLQEVCISAFSDDVQYVYKVAGTSAGMYDLTISGSEGMTAQAVEIPTLRGSLHYYTIDWDSLAQGEQGLRVDIDQDGDGTFEQTITSDSELTGVECGGVPSGELVRNGPNPVSDSGTAFFYAVPTSATSAKIIIFDISGRALFEIPIDPDSTRFPPTGTWNPVDQDGVPLANGPYVYVLSADGKVIGQGKMVIQR